jgi:hypothetical protein
VEAEARLRRFARPKIVGVLDSLPDASGIDLWLALGKECPFSAQWQRTIWCDEIERVLAERKAALDLEGQLRTANYVRKLWEGL